MMKTFHVAALLMAAGLYAAPEANALTLDNGRNLNGRNLNGLSFNGLSFNGRNLNGRNLNGLSFNGLSFNGTAHGSTAVGHATTVILKDGVHVPLK
jgi:uncharacterized protein YjbI with pentapeptide repeats